MPNEKISVLNGDNENPDKMKIALAIRNAHEFADNKFMCILILFSSIILIGRLFIH